MEANVVNIHGNLIARCKAGDRNAHYKLYKLYAKAMFNAAFRIVGREEDAEDVLQDAFVSAFRNLDAYRGDATFGAWLKRIVVNKAISFLKKHRHDFMPDDEHWDIAETGPDEDAIDDLTVERVRNAIQELPDGYRTVLSLYLLEGYDHQEIAGILGISESTSKSQLNRAKAKLRDKLTTRT